MDEEKQKWSIYIQQRIQNTWRKLLLTTTKVTRTRHDYEDEDDDIVFSYVFAWSHGRHIVGK